MNTIRISISNEKAKELFPMFSDFFPLSRPRIAKSVDCLWINPLGIKWSPGSITTLFGFNDHSVFFSRKPGEGHEEYESWAMNQPAMFLEADMTDEMADEIAKHLPAWFDPAIVKRYMGRRGGIDSMKEISSAEDGMYVVRDEICTNQAYALFYADLHYVPLESVEFSPGWKLLFNNKQSRYGGSPLTIWQKGEEIQFKRLMCPHDGEFVLSKENSRFLTAAMKVKSQRTRSVIRMISEATSFSLVELKKKERGPAGNYQGKFLYEIALSSGEKLWMVTTAWGYLGEDGDADESEIVYLDYATAQSRYAEEDPK